MSQHWTQDDAFWTQMMPLLFDEDRQYAAPYEASAILQLLAEVSDAPGPYRVFDQACGIGRHAVSLAQLGHQVCALDRQPSYLKRAEEFAKAEEVNVEFVQGDMRAFERPQGFDVVLNFWTSLGYFSPDENRQVLERAYASLAPGGVLLIDTLGKEIVAQGVQPQRHFEIDGRYFLEDVYVLPGFTHTHTTWTILEGTKKTTQTVELQLYSAYELSELLKSIGFREVKIYGSLEPSAYDVEAERLICTAKV